MFQYIPNSPSVAHCKIFERTNFISFQPFSSLLNENVTFIDHIAQPELLKYYLKAKVHVLPSWFETTGLSSLEAGSMGCNLVVGDRGDVREYFGDFAYYCNPGDVSSVKKAVEQAYHASAKEELRLKIQHEFNWEKAAEMTWKTYNKVLEHD